MNTVGVITFGSNKLDVYNSLDEPLFKAADVAGMIDYSSGNTWKMLEMCEEDEKLNLPLVVAGQRRSVIDIHNQVSVAVSNERDKIAKEVTDKIADRVAKIDEDSLRREVVEKAKEQISDKFDSKLDNLLDDFNSNLNNVSRIYSSIAQSMAGNKEMIFKVG